MCRALLIVNSLWVRVYDVCSLYISLILCCNFCCMDCFFVSTIVGISCWCFTGREEWLAILTRVSNDMTPSSKPVT